MQIWQHTHAHTHTLLLAHCHGPPERTTSSAISCRTPDFRTLKSILLVGRCWHDVASLDTAAGSMSRIVYLNVDSSSRVFTAHRLSRTPASQLQTLCISDFSEARAAFSLTTINVRRPYSKASDGQDSQHQLLLAVTHPLQSHDALAILYSSAFLVHICRLICYL